MKLRTAIEHSMEFLASIENTAPSIWVREYPAAFPTLLVIHALGMGFIAGANLLICLRLMGWASIPLQSLRALQPVILVGFIASLASGLLLLLGYPAKGLTNPVFWFKLILVGLAILVVQRLLARADERSAAVRRWALVALVCWAGSITAGRFLAYTHSVLLASHFV